MERSQQDLSPYLKNIGLYSKFWRHKSLFVTNGGGLKIRLRGILALTPKIHFTCSFPLAGILKIPIVFKQNFRNYSTSIGFGDIWDQNNLWGEESRVTIVSTLTFVHKHVTPKVLIGYRFRMHH